MENHNHLKLQLQSIGPLQAEAWQIIEQNLEVLVLNSGESFHRQRGSLSYIQQGLIKEFTPHLREDPALISLLIDGDFFLSHSQNMHQFLTAAQDSVIYTLAYPHLIHLYQKFPELLTHFELISAQYKSHTDYRMLLLEKSIQERIRLFKSRYKYYYPYLKKRDIANYLHVSYNHLISNW